MRHILKAFHFSGKLRNDFRLRNTVECSELVVLNINISFSSSQGKLLRLNDFVLLLISISAHLVSSVGRALAF